MLAISLRTAGCPVFDPLLSTLCIAHGKKIAVYSCDSGLVQYVTIDESTVFSLPSSGFYGIVCAKNAYLLRIVDLTLIPVDISADTESITSMSAPVGSKVFFVGTSKGRIFSSKFPEKDSRVVLPPSSLVSFPKPVSSVLFSSHDPGAPQRILVCYASGALVLLDFADQTELLELPPRENTFPKLVSVSWHPLGSFFCLFFESGLIEIYEAFDTYSLVSSFNVNSVIRINSGTNSGNSDDQKLAKIISGFWTACPEFSGFYSEDANRHDSSIIIVSRSSVWMILIPFGCSQKSLKIISNESSFSVNLPLNSGVFARLCISCDTRIDYCVPVIFDPWFSSEFVGLIAFTHDLCCTMGFPSENIRIQKIAYDLRSVFPFVPYGLDLLPNSRMISENLKITMKNEEYNSSEQKTCDFRHSLPSKSFLIAKFTNSPLALNTSDDLYSYYYEIDSISKLAIYDAQNMFSIDLQIDFDYLKLMIVNMIPNEVFEEEFYADWYGAFYLAQYVFLNERLVVLYQNGTIVELVLRSNLIIGRDLLTKSISLTCLEESLNDEWMSFQYSIEEFDQKFAKRLYLPFRIRFPEYFKHFESYKALEKYMIQCNQEKLLIAMRQKIELFDLKQSKYLTKKEIFLADDIQAIQSVFMESLWTIIGFKKISREGQLDQTTFYLFDSNTLEPQCSIDIDCTQVLDTIYCKNVLISSDALQPKTKTKKKDEIVINQEINLFLIVTKKFIYSYQIPGFQLISTYEAPAEPSGSMLKPIKMLFKSKSPKNKTFDDSAAIMAVEQFSDAEGCKLRLCLSWCIKVLRLPMMEEIESVQLSVLDPLEQYRELFLMNSCVSFCAGELIVLAHGEQIYKLGKTQKQSKYVVELKQLSERKLLCHPEFEKHLLRQKTSIVAGFFGKFLSPVEQRPATDVTQGYRENLDKLENTVLTYAGEIACNAADEQESLTQEMQKLKLNIGERGEKLNRLEMRFSELADASKKFKETAKRLNKR